MKLRRSNALCRWILTSGLLTILPIPLVAQAEGKPADPDSFTTTTTHVELDSLGRFFKIEVLESKPAAEKKVEAPRKGAGSQYVNILGLMSVDHREYGPNSQDHFLRMGVLRIPFFTVMLFDGDKGFEEDSSINGNLFALFDGVYDMSARAETKAMPATPAQTEKGNVEKGSKMPPEIRYAEARVIDSIVFTAFQTRFEAPEKKYWEILDVPLVTTLSHRTNTDENQWKFLNVPLLWIFRYDQDGTRERTHLVDGPGVALFRRDRKTDQRDKWEFVDLLLLKAMKGRQEKDTSHFGFIESFKLGHGPFLSVYSSDVEKEEREADPERVSSRQFVRLPLLGPVLGTWRDGKGGHFAPFPCIFLSKKNRPQAFQVF